MGQLYDIAKRRVFLIRQSISLASRSTAHLRHLVKIRWLQVSLC